MNKKALEILASYYNKISETREKQGGLAQGCQDITKLMESELVNARIKVDKYWIQSEYQADFTNHETGDQMKYHLFLVADNQVLDPFTSNESIEFQDYLKLFKDNTLFLGKRNAELRYFFDPFDKILSSE